jgi:hypothetical protein
LGCIRFITFKGSPFRKTYCHGFVKRLALILTFSRWEKEQPSHASGFADECPANPAMCIIKKTADVSPGGKGRGEDERFN